MNCTDVGTIQAFLDGELSYEQSSAISGHIGSCDACAAMLSEAETESAMVFAALGREMDTLVPTQRLWNKINDSIEVERAAMPWWRKASEFFSAAFANPMLSAAGAMLLFVVIGGTVWLNREQATDQPVVTVASSRTSAPPAITPTQSATTVSGDPIAPAAVARQERRAIAVTASYRSERQVVRPTAVRAVVESQPAADVSGEESYLSAISSLQRTVREQKEMTMRASERVAFERDLAIVDDSISKMRKEVRRNPKNDSARQVLFTSYQNKIDLLNSVAQKEELVASLN